MDGPAFRRGGRILFCVPFSVSGKCYQSDMGWSQINFNKIEKLRLCVAVFFTLAGSKGKTPEGHQALG